MSSVRAGEPAQSSRMTDFAPYAIRADLTLPDAWVQWAGDLLSGRATPLPQVPPFGQVQGALAKHGLLPLLYDALRGAANWPELPADVRETLSLAFQHNAARSFLLETELRRIGQACEGLILLKGAALGHTVYANPALRPVSDVDLLVDPSRVAEMQAHLARLGYAGVGLTAHPRLGRFARRYRAELPLIGIAPGIGRLLIELHWSLAELPHYVNLIPATALMAGAQPLPDLPPYRVPRPAVLLAYAAGHLALHHSRDLRLMWLVDLDRLARSGFVDWADLLAIAEAWKLGLALHAGLTVAQRWLDTPLDEAVMRELSRLAQDRIAVQSWGLGDEVPGRALRRALTALTALPIGSAVRYAGWLAARVALRPTERRLIEQQQAQQERGQ